MRPSPAPDEPTHTHEMTPRDWWALLVRQRFAAAGAASLVAVGGAVVSATATPLYRARSRVVVAAPVPQTRGAGELAPLPATENTATQVELLLSESLLQRAREAADLPGDLGARFHVRIENTPGSDVIDVVAEGPQAEGTAALANALVDRHVAESDQSRLQIVRSMTAFLMRERSTAKDELERIDRRMAVLRERQKRPVSSATAKPEPAESHEVPASDSAQLRALRAAIQSTEQKIAQSRRESGAGSVPTGTVGTGNTEPTSVLPDVWSRRRVLEERLRQQTAEYRQLASATVQRETALRIDNEMRQLRHRREAAVAALRSTTERLVEVRTRGAAVGKPFRSIEPAGVPKRPFWPDPRVQFSVTLLGAGIAGLLVAVVRERLVARIETAEQVERLGLSLLGVVPCRAVSRTPDENASWEELLDGMEFAGVGHSIRVLMVLPVAERGGGIGFGQELARAMARAGRAVCWVDADLRPSKVPHGAPPVRRGLGLSQVLAGMRSEDQVLAPDDLPNLWRLASGPVPPNPLDLLGSNAAASLLARLGERFEVVVVEAHPCLDRPDALRLAAKVDGIILAANSGRLRPVELVQAVEAVRASGGQVVGVVLERANVPLSLLAARREGHPAGASGIYRRGGQQDERG